MGKTVIQKDLSYLEKYFGDKYQRRFISPQDSHSAIQRLQICFILFQEKWQLLI